MFDAGTRAIPHTTQLVPETTERGIKRRNIVVSDNKMERLKTLLAHESNRCEKNSMLTAAVLQTADGGGRTAQMEPITVVERNS